MRLGLRRHRFWLGLGLLCLAFAAAALLIQPSWLALPGLPGKDIVLTGNDRSGKLEVPVLNLWAKPGFGGDNRVVARLKLPPEGETWARLQGRQEVGGLTWMKVRLADGSTGWLFARFVVE